MSKAIYAPNEPISYIVPNSGDNARQYPPRRPKLKQKPKKPPPISSLPPKPYLRPPVISFSLYEPPDAHNIGARLATLTFRRSKTPSWTIRDGTPPKDVEGFEEIQIDTPGVVCGTTRGIVKHLTKDHLAIAKGTEWLHISFENYLELSPPVPLFHPAALPLHTFLTHPPSRHVLALSVRDPGANQNMPANTNAFIQVQTIRGVKKVSNEEWCQWARILRPDVLYALPDVPKTQGGANEDEAVGKVSVIPGEGRAVSQKRTGKSLDRTAAWLEGLLSETTPQLTDGELNEQRPPVFVQLMGGRRARARDEFSRMLVGKLDKPDSEKVGGLRTLDEGVAGYVAELVDLPTKAFRFPPPPDLNEREDQTEEEFEENVGDDSEGNPVHVPVNPSTVTSLIRTSLELLPQSKPRIAHTAPSPHSILRLILECGIDLFETVWATEAADLGVALEFEFPAPTHVSEAGLLPIGRNLFDEQYATDFSILGVGLHDHSGCASCQPRFSDAPLMHSKADERQLKDNAGAGYTRAYIHHLLHTHEMTSYTLLHLHNLAIVEEFFVSIRTILKLSCSEFEKEVRRFYDVYDPSMHVLEEARVRWGEVENARGKGRLKRERETAAAAAVAQEGIGGWAAGVEPPAVPVEAVRGDVELAGEPASITGDGLRKR